MSILTVLTISLASMVLDPQGGHTGASNQYQDSISRPYSAPGASLQSSSLPSSKLSGNWKKPGRWCGWYMRKHLGVAHQRYNVARNWATWGSAARPQIGAVVVWPHHVGQIVGQNQRGQWLILSGNDGGKVRTRPWNNLHKVIAYRI